MTVGARSRPTGVARLNDVDVPVGRGSDRAVARDDAGGLRSVVAATALPAGIARKSGQRMGEAELSSVGCYDGA